MAVSIQERLAARAKQQPSRMVRAYVGILSGLLVLQGALGVALKVQEGRTDDLVHNALHVASGLSGLLLALLAGGRHARAFALGFGASYLALGGLGWVWTNPFGVLPLGRPDHVLHLTAGALTLAVALWPDDWLRR